jgi:hypothetical protein
VIVSFVDFGGIVKFNNNNVLKLYRNERERRQQGQQLITAPIEHKKKDRDIGRG